MLQLGFDFARSEQWHSEDDRFGESNPTVLQTLLFLHADQNMNSHLSYAHINFWILMKDRTLRISVISCRVKITILACGDAFCRPDDEGGLVTRMRSSSSHLNRKSKTWSEPVEQIPVVTIGSEGSIKRCFYRPHLRECVRHLLPSLHIQ